MAYLSLGITTMDLVFFRQWAPFLPLSICREGSEGIVEHGPMEENRRLALMHNGCKVQRIELALIKVFSVEICFEIYLLHPV
jgi:hypothetical protein